MSSSIVVFLPYFDVNCRETIERILIFMMSKKKYKTENVRERIQKRLIHS